MLCEMVIAAALCAHAGPSVNSELGRDALLAEAPPYPFGRVDSAARLENGRLWHPRFPVGSRTPLPERVTAEPGAASYGAARGEVGRVVYARVLHAAIAIDPWERIEGRGVLAHLEAARQQWLREHGYVLRVRTHVNPAALRAPEVRPRATIEVDRDVIRPIRQHVDSGRISAPWWSEGARVTVVEAAAEESVERVAAR